MGLSDDLRAALEPGTVSDVRRGRRWTAVVVESGGEVRCGLAATLSEAPAAPAQAPRSGLALAAWAGSADPERASLGAAAVNALLPTRRDLWRDEKAEAILTRLGAGKVVAMIGHFPFAGQLRARVGALHVIERRPAAGDKPETAAAELLPRADVVAITGMAFVNGSLEALLALCPPRAAVMVLGPSTPLSPVLFDYGVDLLCGVEVTGPAVVLAAVASGGRLSLEGAAGLRRVCMQAGGRPGV